MKPNKALSSVWRALTSLKLTIACLGLLMALVFACTLAQTHMGTFAAVKAYIRSPFVYWTPQGSARKIPICPGGGLIGVILLLNLMAAQFSRLEKSWRKAGIWVIHFGLILLFAGEFVTSFFQVETQMILSEGGSRNYAEDLRDNELAVIDVTEKDYDQVYSIPESRLAPGAAIEDRKLPFTLRVADYRAGPLTDGRPAEAALSLVLSRDGMTLGSWNLATPVGPSPSFTLGDRSYRMSLRAKRRYFPFFVTLKKFTHEIYPGTDIPRRFASLVRLVHPWKMEDRDVLISMNNPLRYGGMAFYQASFEKDDTVSILQVVRNPGWLIPYLSCALVTAGLLIHFLLRLRPALEKSR